MGYFLREGDFYSCAEALCCDNFSCSLFSSSVLPKTKGILSRREVFFRANRGGLGYAWYKPDLIC